MVGVKVAISIMLGLIAICVIAIKQNKSIESE